MRKGHLSSSSKAVFVFFMLAALGSVAHAQGLLVNVAPDAIVRLPRPRTPGPHPLPVPESTYKIKALEIDANLSGQVAQVQVSQSFVNTGSRPLEVAFLFPLPYDGAIDQLTLLVDGKEHPARLLPKDEARRLYESIVRKNQDPALLEWMGTGVFQTSVFPLPPGQERKVTLRYTQLCRMQGGLTDFLFPLSTAKYTAEPVERVAARVTIDSTADIQNVYSPTHKVAVERTGRRATATYEGKNEIPAGDFRLLYDVGSQDVGMSVVSHRPKLDDDGFFLLLASPRFAPAEAKPLPKTVVFVVDRSGSMSGDKIEQAKEATRFVLNNLREGDLFNIVAYDSEVTSFRPELQRFDDESRSAALGFVNGMHAGGSTNISAALTTALGQLKDASRPSYVIFLTDGLPTAGETNEMKIVELATTGNDVRARIIPFGVGYDVNSRLLDKLARENFGTSEYVRPDEDIEAVVARLFKRIESPVLTDVQIAFDVEGRRPEDGAVVNRMYPGGTIDLFAGDQLVIVGRYNKGGAARVRLTGQCQGETKTFDFTADLSATTSSDSTNAFVERLWAVRRVGEIIDQLDLQGPNQELIKELVQLSTQHGIMTPYTSFLAEEETDLAAVTVNAATAGTRLSLLERQAGQSGFAQRAEKAALMNAALPAATVTPASGAPGQNATYRDAETDELVVESRIQQLGDKTFYCRDKRWIDSSITDEEVKKAKRVAQFSDEYFHLASTHGPSLAKCLVSDEPIVVRLGRDVYLIEPQSR